MPETARYSLEELDVVFKQPRKELAKHGGREAVWFYRHYILRQPGRRPRLVPRRLSEEVDGGMGTQLVTVADISRSVRGT